MKKLMTILATASVVMIAAPSFAFVTVTIATPVDKAKMTINQGFESTGNVSVDAGETPTHVSLRILDENDEELQQKNGTLTQMTWDNESFTAPSDEASYYFEAKAFKNANPVVWYTNAPSHITFTTQPGGGGGE